MTDSESDAGEYELPALKNPIGETVRITVDLDADLHRRLKAKALLENKRLAALIRDWIEINTQDISDL